MKKYIAPRAEKIGLCTEGLIANSNLTLDISEEKTINTTNDILSSGKDDYGLWSDMD